ncbi:MAG: DUF5305 domain-containing protein [Thermoplasmata archaeon]|nr:DUF5305 domain-containing protein [Thermoplasmata archaeon]
MRLTTVVLVALVLGAIVAGYALVSAETAAPPGSSTHDVVSYQGSAAFNYEATIRPNALQPNGSVLGPGEGPLFATEMTNVNLSVSYTMQAAPSATVELSGGFDLIASGGGVWNYTLNDSFPHVRPVSEEGSATLNESTEVNVAKVLAFFVQVQNQTNYEPVNETLQFVPVVFATIVGGGLSTEIVPKSVLTFSLESGQWVPTSNVGASSGALTTTSPSSGPNNGEDVEIALGALLLVLAAIGVVGYLEFRAVQRSRREIDVARQLRQFTTPYKDAIADTATPPRNENVVSMYDWEDLVHVADMLGKPILQFRYHRPDDTRHFFYVLDGSVQYVYLVPVDGRSEEGKAPYDTRPT